MDPITETAILTVTTAAAIIFGPYLPKENVMCNNGSSWNCYCSISSSSLLDTVDTVPRCVDLFRDADVVSVDFRECKLKLETLVTNEQTTLEVYLKNYLISWIKQECAMSPCHGFKGRDSDIQIAFVLLACSNEDNTRLMINAMQSNLSNSDGGYEQFPTDTFARILTDRVHLLQYYLGTTVVDISVSKVPKYSTIKKLVQQNELLLTPNETESISKVSLVKFNWTALIIGGVLAAYVCIVWVIACYLCHK